MFVCLYPDWASGGIVTGPPSSVPNLLSEERLLGTHCSRVPEVLALASDCIADAALVKAALSLPGNR